MGAAPMALASMDWEVATQALGTEQPGAAELLGRKAAREAPAALSQAARAAGTEVVANAEGVSEEAPVALVVMVGAGKAAAAKAAAVVDVAASAVSREARVGRAA